MKKFISFTFLLTLCSVLVFSESSRWNVASHRNEFNEATIYTFTLQGPGDDLLFFGYVKNDVPAKSLVRAGIVWRSGNTAFPSKGEFIIKCEDGNILNKTFDYPLRWDENVGIATTISSKKRLEVTKSNTEKTRDFIDLFENNKILTIKKRNDIRKFQIPSVKEAVEKAGLSYEEFDSAIANEEF